MSQQNTGIRQWPEVNSISLGDLGEIIGKGLDDFRRAPIYGLVFAALYALAGWLLFILLWLLGLPYLAYPLAMGFALIAPFAAVGFYAVSQKLEDGSRLSWSTIWSSIRDAAGRDLRWMALVTGFALVLWMDIAAILFFALMGFESFGPQLFERILTTSTGLTFLLLGNITGALIALAIFSISVVSFPMLFDRDVDFVTAMVTSVRLVIANPISMICWCALIGLLIVASVASGFLGLLIVLPLVGHASWHLYRRAVEPASADADQSAAVRA